MSRGDDSTTVLVAGAGPVGLMMASELTRHGVPCRVVDSKSGPTDESRALGIQARTLEIFGDIGVVDAVLGRARKVHGVAALDGSRRIMHLTFDLDGMDSPYPYLLILPQSETERILLGHLNGQGVEVEWGTKLDGFEPDADGVSAHLVDSSGGRAEVRASYLVGCDGARSAVRKALGLPFDGADYEESFLLADVAVDWDRPEDEMTILLTPEGPLVAFPFPEAGRWRLIHSSTAAVTPEDAEPARATAMFQEKIRGHGMPGVTVSDPTWTSAFKIHRRVAARFRVGRCFIAGDAAHIHSPVGGQGMNTGIQDAYNLGWKLGLVAKGASPDSLLDSYTPERRPVVAGVLRETDAMTRIVTLRNPVAKGVRDHLAGLLGELDFVARRVSRGLSELEVEYHASPIVAEDRPALLSPDFVDALGFRASFHPGDRVPDVPLEPPGGSDGPTRLFEVLRGTRHVLLLFEGAHGAEDGRPFGAIRDLVRGRSDQIDAYLVARGDAAPPDIAWDGPVLLDHLGELHRRFGARGACLYLIRPDGYLGYRAMPPDPGKLSEYLRKIFV